MSYIISEKTKTALQQLLSIPEVADGLNYIEKDQDHCIAEQIELTLTESPTFHEETRANLFKNKFEDLGLSDVHIDRGGNVV